ncbi:MAG: HU family DNA-binding protein [Alicyclobacillus sp.]|nr:HU family DNA-binding protein [Alicyclobacillus sp.]
MNKSELIQAVAERTGMTKKDVNQIVEAVFDAISDALARGEKVQLVGFGNFEIRERAARKGRNPQTGEVIDIAASKVPAFRAGKALREGIQ